VRDTQIIISIIKKGAGKKPDYTMKLFENGLVEYEGYENIKIIGKVKTTIKKIRFLELLADFRNLNFFSLWDDYSIIDDPNQPRTIISISIPVETGEIRTKSVTYFQKDPSIPESLKKIENKINEIVDFNKWDKSYIDKQSEIETIEEIKEIDQIKKIDKEKPIVVKEKILKEKKKLKKLSRQLKKIY